MLVFNEEKLAGQASDWLSVMLKEDQPDDVTLHAWLQDGTVLCRLAEVMKPDILSGFKVHKGTTSRYHHLENHRKFLDAALALGVKASYDPAADLTADRIMNVVHFVHSVARIAYKMSFPPIGIEKKAMQAMLEEEEEEPLPLPPAPKEPRKTDNLAPDEGPVDSRAVTPEIDESVIDESMVGDADDIAIEADTESVRLEMRRQDVVKEIMETEAAYVQNLSLVLKHFLDPIEQKKLLSRDEIGLVFSNIRMIAQLNTQFLGDLEADGPAKAFVKFAPILKTYTVYCVAQDMGSLERLTGDTREYNAQFSKFVEAQQKIPELRNLNLGAYLIMPIQRLCKYPLLLREMLKCTPEDDEDRPLLEKALEAVSQTAKDVNEKSRDFESRRAVAQVQDEIEGGDALALLQPTRKFLREGDFNVYIHAKKKWRVRRIVLFNDLLLVTKRTKKKQLLEEQMKMTSLLVKNLDLTNVQAFSLVDTRTSAKIIVQVKTDQDKATWVTLLDTLVEEAMEKAGQEVKRQIQLAEMAKSAIADRYKSMLTPDGADSSDEPSSDGEKSWKRRANAYQHRYSVNHLNRPSNTELSDNDSSIGGGSQRQRTDSDMQAATGSDPFTLARARSSSIDSTSGSPSPVKGSMRGGSAEKEKKKGWRRTLGLSWRKTTKFTYEDMQKAMEDATSEIEEKTKENDKLKKDLEAANQTIAALRKEMEDLKAKQASTEA